MQVFFIQGRTISPEKCSLNQNNGPVWFLADGKDTDDNSQPEIRECTVPKGKALLVQIVGSGCGMNEGYKNDQELLDCAVWYSNGLAICKR